MVINQEWFDQAPAREKRRTQRGVSLKTAIRELQTTFIHSYLTASEMAEWIYHHWTLEQFMRLPDKERDTVMKVVESTFTYPGVRQARRARKVKTKAEWAARAELFRQCSEKARERREKAAPTPE